MMQLECSRHCFAPLIQIDLDLTRSEWNRLHIRKQSSADNVTFGSPSYLYNVPEKNEATGCSHPVSQDYIDRSRMNHSTKPSYCSKEFVLMVNEMLPNRKIPVTLSETRKLYSVILREIARYVRINSIVNNPSALLQK